MKEKKAVTYESPYTREMQVSLESGICGASVVNHNDPNVQINAHGDGGFDSVWGSYSGWDSIDS